MKKILPRVDDSKKLKLKADEEKRDAVKEAFQVGLYSLPTLSWA